MLMSCTSTVFPYPTLFRSRQHIGRARRRGNDIDTAEAGEVAQDRALDAEVVRDDREVTFLPVRVRHGRSDIADDGETISNLHALAHAVVEVHVGHRLPATE